jgi:hypothetical protein
MKLRQYLGLQTRYSFSIVQVLPFFHSASPAARSQSIPRRINRGEYRANALHTLKKRLR